MASAVGVSLWHSVRLTPGARLGPYEIIAPLGAGGMGEVYRARDTRLGRTVAVKILSAEFIEDDRLRVRFEREAKAISALNHPHICALYDVGPDYLVMEHCEGKTLARRLSEGALPLEQVFDFGIQIAEALDKAHRQGIVHRDLKPSNIMVTKSGVKLLDFGLAKEQLASSPDQSTVQQVTEQGTLLGTIQYMAPEVLQGEEADQRSDIFALGLVLYEMATAKPAFSGASKASLIAAILEHEPQPMTALAPMTPPALDRLTKLCLKKDPDCRWQSAYDVAEELRWVRDGPTSGAVIQSRRTLRRRMASSIAVVLAIAAAVIGGYVMHTPRSRQPVRFALQAPAGTSLRPPQVLGFALSRDGTQLAFCATGGDGKPRLWIRALDAFAAREVPETEDASFPFWSPDGRFVAFFADRKLKRVNVTSVGTPETIADAPAGRGGTWSDGGVILFAPDIYSSIYKVVPGERTVAPVTRCDPKTEAGHRWPVFLPDGEHFLYQSRPAGEGEVEANVFVTSLRSNTPRVVLRDASNPQFVAPDLILFGRHASLLAQRFDPRRLQTVGEPFGIVDEKISYYEPRNLLQYAAASSSLVFYPRVTFASQLGWVDRQGRQTGTIDRDVFYSVDDEECCSKARLSPDETLIAAVRAGEGEPLHDDIWLIDLVRNHASRFTFSPGHFLAPRWSADGRRLFFNASMLDLSSKDLSGGAVRSIDLSPRGKNMADVSPDGKWLLYLEQNPVTNFDVMLRSLTTPDAQPRAFVSSPAREEDAVFSPDGKWVAFASSLSGSLQVYVRSFTTEEQWQVSKSGVARDSVLLWRRDGKEILFVSPENKLMSVEVSPGPAFIAGEPKELFSLSTGADSPVSALSDVTRNGQRILLTMRRPGEGANSLKVIVGWRRDG